MTEGGIDIENLRELSLKEQKEICDKCQVSTQLKSKASYKLVLSTFKCIVASKLLALTESVRDAADIYMSLKYPPTVFINDTPCGLVRHMEIQCPEFSKQMWSDRRGCFERPNLDSEPHAVQYVHFIKFYFILLNLFFSQYFTT